MSRRGTGLNPPSLKLSEDIWELGKCLGTSKSVKRTMYRGGKRNAAHLVHLWNENNTKNSVSDAPAEINVEPTASLVVTEINMEAVESPAAAANFNAVLLSVADPGGGTGGTCPPVSVPYLASPRIYACGSHARAGAGRREFYYTRACACIPMNPWRLLSASRSAQVVTSFFSPALKRRATEEHSVSAD